MWSGHVVWYLYKECGSHTREAAEEEFDSIWNRFRLCCHPASEKKESYHLDILKSRGFYQILVSQGVWKWTHVCFGNDILHLWLQRSTSGSHILYMVVGQGHAAIPACPPLLQLSLHL